MSDDGVTIEFLSRDKLSSHALEDKLELVIEKVKDDAVLVLEEGWTPEEKRTLITNAMEQVDDDFPGIEFMGLDSGQTRLDKARNLVYDKLFDEKARRGLTIVGNSRVMEKIKEERDAVSFLAKLESEKE